MNASNQKSKERRSEVTLSPSPLSVQGHSVICAQHCTTAGPRTHCGRQNLVAQSFKGKESHRGPSSGIWGVSAAHCAQEGAREPCKQSEGAHT